MTVLVVDYGMGNLGSVRRSLEECGADVRVSDQPGAVAEATHIVLPGVGSFDDGMHNLEVRGWIPHLRQAAVDEGIPFLGICLGMQMLAEKGEEGVESRGLGMIAGEVRRLVPLSPTERIPHVGWNEVYPEVPSPLFDGISAGSDFYFVHSFHFQAAFPDDVLARTPYCGSFVSAVVRDNIVGVQFHPEKSSRGGLQLLRNFLGLGSRESTTDKLKEESVAWRARSFTESEIAAPGLWRQSRRRFPGY